MSAKRLQELLASAWGVRTAPERQRLKAMSHMDILREGSSESCRCGGAAPTLWEEVLGLATIDVGDYRRSLLTLFKQGGGRPVNHLYTGAPNSGKTLLTLSPAKLFGKERVFYKPQASTTSYCLSGLQQKRCLIWNDFRWPMKGLAWQDMLCLCNNESFRIGLPKSEYREDHQWNATGEEGVVVFLTTNVDIVFLRGGAVDHEETKAFLSRFRKFSFPNSFARPDPSCTSRAVCVACWSKWVLEAPEVADSERVESVTKKCRTDAACSQ
jgi:hypothetical protein